MGVLSDSGHLQTAVDEVLVGTAEVAGCGSDTAVRIVRRRRGCHDVGCRLIQVGRTDVEALLNFLKAASSVKKLYRNTSQALQVSCLPSQLRLQSTLLVTSELLLAIIIMPFLRASFMLGDFVLDNRLLQD